MTITSRTLRAFVATAAAMAGLALPAGALAAHAMKHHHAMKH